MGPLAAAFWATPRSALAVVGVTGTNGKTTTTHLLAAVLEDGRLADRRHRHADRAPSPPPRRPSSRPGWPPFRRRGPARRRHGGLVPRPRPAPGRRHPLRRGRVHQPRPRPPRLPRHRSSATSPPRPACSSPAERPWRVVNRRRPPRPPARRRRAHPHAASRWPTPTTSTVGPTDGPFTWRGHASAPARRPLQRGQRRWPRPRPPPRSGSTTTPSPPAWRGAAGAGPVRGRRRRPALHGGRRLRPHARRPGRGLLAGSPGR